MADETPQIPPFEESSPLGRLPEVEVPSSPATELNTMTQGDLDRLRETYFFLMGVQMRISKKGETVLYASAGDVAFYEAALPAGLRFPMHPTIKWILNFYDICPAQLSPNAWKNIISMLVIWQFYQRHLSLNEFRCLYALLKGPGSESGWLYFKARPNKNILKRRFFFVSRDDWEFHPSIPCEEGAVRVLRSWGAPGKQCNKVSILYQTEDERFCQVFEKMGGGHFKISVILNSRPFRKYFAPDRVEMSLNGSDKAEGDIRGEAEGDIGGVTIASVGDATMSKRIKLSKLTKVVVEKAATSSSTGMVISKASEMASKNRALDDGPKGKQVVPLLEAKKIKVGSVAHVAPARPPVIPDEGSSARLVLGEALVPKASMMASAAIVKKILAGIILPTDKEKGALTEEKAKRKKAAEEVEAKNNEVAGLKARVAALEKSQNLAKRRIIAVFKESNDFQEAVMGLASSYFSDCFNFCKRQLGHQYPNLGIDLEDIEMDRDFLVQEEANRGEDEDGVEEK
ncbi:Protein naked cuticle 1 like [Actinidia chinensis var. chinensis]|uniref:Protein naked cuticle 1 like n=1 Tax=Actinidia chinensis var. chinensis TaxID=1590841 RepID=A0A2R6QHJ2_ACTCC|nr:Protein naked cuticle 1 like [Actinidia chinensis var. chinensis]